ncbi:MAG: hypothetical protein ACREBS_00645 [Nitrososphaerales archaeon]
MHKTRLVEFFGDAGVKIIFEHMNDLEQAFGSASAVIVKVMEGQLPQHPKKDGNNI